MKKLMNYVTIAVTIIAFLGASAVCAQEYTDDQKEVWKVVEDFWADWEKSDPDAGFAFVHDSYLGWNNEDPMPTSKAKWLNSLKKYSPFLSNMDYDIDLARILVHKDVAVVHYYFTFSFLYTEGDVKEKVGYHGKWTEFFIKEKGNWMLLGDMTYSEANK